MLLVATTRENVSPSLVLELLKRIGGIIKVREAAFLSDYHQSDAGRAPHAPSALALL